MLRTLKNLFKLFILSGKLDLKKSYSTFEGCVFSLKESTINIRKEVAKWTLLKLENILQVNESPWG